MFCLALPPRPELGGGRTPDSATCPNRLASVDSFEQALCHEPDELRAAPKSGGWTCHPDHQNSPENRLLSFTLTVRYDGKRLGGTNIQVVVGAPDQPRHGLNEDVALWLDSGWCVTFRNQFALAPCVGTEIILSVANQLSVLTVEATSARGPDAAELTHRLFSTTFHGEGPAYWP